jgi:hypothetical protein
MALVLLWGLGDAGSADKLYSNAFRVLIHGNALPSHARCGMALTDALFDGKAELAGVLAKRARVVFDTGRMSSCGEPSS